MPKSASSGYLGSPRCKTEKSGTREDHQIPAPELAVSEVSLSQRQMAGVNWGARVGHRA